MASILAQVGETMLSSLARLLRFGTTVFGPGGTRIRTWLKSDNLMKS